MWKGSISFGLVNIPISLSVAVRQKDVRFHQLHDEDGGRITEKRFCERDGKEVPYEHVVKGYEISKGRYVTVTRDELRAIDPEADKTIGIEAFVQLEEVDPIYFERTYYVLPEGKGAGRAYALLATALEKSGRGAVARIVLSTQQHLCLIRARDGRLLLTTMVYGDEVEELPEVADATVSPKETQMAQSLVDQMVTHFEPDKYTDTHRERVLELLHRKAEGETIEAPREVTRAQVTNLTEALERSLAVQKGEESKPAPKRSRARGNHKRSAHVH